MTTVGNRAAVLGVATTALFALILTGFLLVVTSSMGDVVPRPFVLLALYLAPAVIGWLGLRQGDAALLASAGAVLIPASFLSFAGVTLIFLIPAGLLIAGAGIASRDGRSVGGLASMIRAAVAAVLVLVAGWAVLLEFTEARCFETATGSGCSSGATSVTGVVIGAALVAAAIALAAWPLARRPDEARM